MINFASAARASLIGSKVLDDWCGTPPPRPPIAQALAAALGNSRLEQAGLNPQPLPPSQFAGVSHQQGRVLLDDDWCATVPKRFPIPPRPPGGPFSGL